MRQRGASAVSVDGEDRAGGREAMVAGVPRAEYWRGCFNFETDFYCQTEFESMCLKTHGYNLALYQL